MIPLYRVNVLPLFGIGRIFLLLYHYGRVSGKEYITPLQYRRYKGRIVVFSVRGEDADWYQNCLSKPDSMRIKMGFSKYHAEVKIIDPHEYSEIMQWYVSEFPFAARKLIGWNPDKDDISSLDAISSAFTMIEFMLKK
jgi:deazaflavin-dependent oxidoreductase (nitroreductase family)